MKLWLARALAIAIAVWGMPASCDHVGQRWKPMRSATARADLDRCRVLYSTTPPQPWTWPRLCSATVHEVGHLDGRHHSTNPRSIMYPRLVIHPRCRPRPRAAQPLCGSVRLGPGLRVLVPRLLAVGPHAPLHGATRDESRECAWT